MGRQTPLVALRRQRERLRSNLKKLSADQQSAFFFTGMGLMFGAYVAYMGDNLTSKQWIYLMSVPGGKWAWSISFTVTAALGLYGLLRAKLKTAAAGTCAVGFLCILIAAFYTLAPLVDPSLVTAGWWPWIVAGAAAIYSGRKLLPTDNEA